MATEPGGRGWGVGFSASLEAGRFRPDSSGPSRLALALTHVVPQRSRIPAEASTTGPPSAERAGTAEPDVRAAVAAAPWVAANTVHWVRKYVYCEAPYRPGSWAAKVSYHCPTFPGFPGNTAPAYVTIPDEFIGLDPRGVEQYRCRPRSSVVNRLEIGDAAATTLTRSMLFLDFNSCHAGFRSTLALVLAYLFEPSGGLGHTWGGRVNQSPPRDFPGT